MKQKLIINLYVPINTILICNDEWRQSLNLPKLTQNDLKIINQLNNSSALPYIGGELINQREIVIDSNICIRKVKQLSFYQYLLDRLLNEARNVAQAGIRNFLIENSNAPYFDNKSPVIYWIMRCLTAELKLICTEEFTIGLKINSHDDWAIDIACRNKIDYVYINKCSAQLLFKRNYFTHKSKIYYQFDENNFSIIQEGFIIDEEKIKDKKEYFTNINGCQNYLKQLLFYPKDITIPIIIDLWQEDKLNLYCENVDYIICNSCFSKDGYADCGIELNKILSL